MNVWSHVKRALRKEPIAPHLETGRVGEREAKRHLKQRGLKFLTANFRSKRGEIDLVFRDGDCLVFIEVKTRSFTSWTRPAAAVNSAKKRRLSRVAMEYVRLLENPEVRIRFDIVEVLVDGKTIHKVRHLPNAFSLSPPLRFG
ncbi:MAG: YraN family protein [Verrucomicrobia bacterium]|nr:YraN family protein [Verrucomicrobiota bacterium]